ncbi:MAG TPA: hypothetical protein VI359_01980 [Nitrospiraceae bacterium]
MDTTRGRRCNQAGLLVLFLMVAGFSCARTPVPLDLTSPDPSQDQRKIAGYHSREATVFRLKADEFSQRVMVYERLFGPESEWVEGARLLVQFYEDAAKEQERLAGWHLDIANNGRSQSMRPTLP